MLTVGRLSITGSLKRTLASTNPCESMIECVRRTSRNVKRWASGEMALRWTAAGMLEAERQFRRIIGYRDLAKLAVAIERDLARTTGPSPTEEAGAAQRRALVVALARVTGEEAIEVV
jgi:putative transposase